MDSYKAFSPLDHTEIKKKQYIIIDFNKGTDMITIFMIACHHTETPTIDENKIHSTSPSEPSVVIEEDLSVGHHDTGIRNTDNLKCYDGVIQIVLIETRMEFEAYLHDIQINVVDFEDVNTTSDEPVSIESDRYLISHGVYITGTDGQYVDDEFLWTSDYNSTSGTNMYAPGPIEIDAGGFTTTIRFQEENCVYGIGMMFIDADFPELGPSGIEIFNFNEEQLQETTGFSSPSGSAIFRGFITLNEQGNIVKGIASSRITNGNVWPMSNCCDGVVLDDLMFGIDK